MSLTYSLPIIEIEEVTVWTTCIASIIRGSYDSYPEFIARRVVGWVHVLPSMFSSTDRDRNNIFQFSIMGDANKIPRTLLKKKAVFSVSLLFLPGMKLNINI